MTWNMLKGVLGVIMGVAGVAIPMLPPQYQNIAVMLMGLFGGGAHLASAANSTTNVKKVGGY